MSLTKYPKIYSLESADVRDIFDEPVIIQEKLDGSRISFGLIDGELHIRSRGKDFDLNEYDNMFKECVEYIKSLKEKLKEGWIYRGEYLRKPRHNTLVYERIPNNHIMMFDIKDENNRYLTQDELKKESSRLNLESAPILFQGTITELKQVDELLQTDSYFGNSKVEGVVIKNYEKFKDTNGIMLAKVVAEHFKEVQKSNKKRKQVNKDSKFELIAKDYQTEARWRKAYEHLRDEGKIKHSPEDLKLLFQEINRDVLEECETELKDRLFKAYWGQMSKIITNGLPQWYKIYLNKLQEEHLIDKNTKK